MQRATLLADWFETPLGQRLFNVEADIVQTILPDLFGYHLVQIGSIGQGRLLDSSRIMHRCIACSDTHFIPPSPYSLVCAHADALPFAADSIDVAVMPHSLEFADEPHTVLREVQRVLIPEGHIMLLGFNPLSLWGVWGWFLARRQTAPWCGDFVSLLRIKDWLALLGFDLIRQETLFFAPPFRNKYLVNHTQFLDRMGSRNRWANNLGAVYILVAKKRVMTLTPLKPMWLPTPALVASAPVGTNKESAARVFSEPNNNDAYEFGKFE